MSATSAQALAITATVKNIEAKLATIEVMQAKMDELQSMLASLHLKIADLSSIINASAKSKTGTASGSGETKQDWFDSSRFMTANILKTVVEILAKSDHPKHAFIAQFVTDVRNANTVMNEQFAKYDAQPDNIKAADYATCIAVIKNPAFDKHFKTIVLALKNIDEIKAQFAELIGDKPTKTRGTKASGTNASVDAQVIEAITKSQVGDLGSDQASPFVWGS